MSLFRVYQKKVEKYEAQSFFVITNSSSLYGFNRFILGFAGVCR